MIKEESLEEDIENLERTYNHKFSDSGYKANATNDDEYIETLISFAAKSNQDFIHAMVLVLKHILPDGLDVNKRKLDCFSMHMVKINLLSTFDLSKIYKLFINNKHYQLENKRVTLPVFRNIVQEMVVSEIYKNGIDSLEIDFFAKRVFEELDGLEYEDNENSRKYVEVKTNYLKVYEELGDITYEVQNQKLQNQNIIIRYRTLFPEIVDVQQSFYKRNNLKMQKELLDSDPSLSLEAIMEMTSEKRHQGEKEINAMRLDSAIGDRNAWMLGFENKIDEEMLETEKERGKKLARKIALLAHDDTIQNHPQYKLLTDNQKEELKRCFAAAMDVKTSELGFSPEQVGFQLRSTMELKSILNKVKKIIDNAGIDVDVDFIPTGDTILQKIEWFQEQTLFLESLIVEEKKKLVALLNNPDVKENRKQLVCPELYDDIRAGLVRMAEKYNEESQAYIQKISEIIHSNEE